MAAEEGGEAMGIRHVNPETVAPPTGYTHVVVAEGRKMIFLAGQVPHAVDGTLVGSGDVVAQARQCFQNLRAGLEAVGASPSDLVKITVFVVDYDPSQRDGIIAARDEVLAFDVPPASTFVGIQRLVRDEWLIEVEAVAVTA
jgi:enamine deaminase RidA (YjgF/YER057c/UK114 family)